MLKPLAFCIFFLFFVAISSYSQNPADMPMRQVMSEAQELIGAGDYGSAAPYLDQLEIRFAGEGNPEVEKILEQFGFVRGVGYIQNFGKTGDMSNMQKAARYASISYYRIANRRERRKLEANEICTRPLVSDADNPKTSKMGNRRYP